MHLFTLKFEKLPIPIRQTIPALVSRQRFTSLTNTNAHKLITDLQFKYGKNNSDPNLNNKVINKALQIYSNISEEKTNVSINAFLKICLRFKHPKQAMIVCSDISKLLSNDKKTNKNISYATLLKCCIQTHDFEMGQTIHSNFIRKTKDIFTQTSLIQFYGHFGDIQSANNIFNALTSVNNFTIATIMKALIGNGLSDESLIIYEEYLHLSDNICHLLAIKACVQSNERRKGMQIIHSKISTDESNIELLNAVIDFYGHFGDICKAQMIFSKIKCLDIISVNSLMKAFVNNSQFSKALQLYDSIESSKLRKDNISHTLAIKACANLKDLDSFEKGKRIHSRLPNNTDLELRNCLISFYGEFSDICSAEQLFAEASARTEMSAATLNSLMKAFVNNEQSSKALIFYEKYSPFKDGISHTLALKACIHCNDFKKGMQIISNNSETNSVEFETVKIEFFGYFGDVNESELIFNKIHKIHKCDVISVSAMMSAFISNDLGQRALQLYNESLCAKDNISHILALKACMNSNDFETAKIIIHSNMSDKCESIELLNTLIDLFGHFEDCRKAVQIFESIKNPQIATVNAMMNAYCASQMNKECIALFESITDEASMISYAIVLKACTQSTLFHFGQSIHKRLLHTPSLQCLLSETSIQINLIHLYGKCGDLDMCEKIFEQIKTDSAQKEKYLNEIKIWNAMIKAFGRNGDYTKFKEILREMKENTQLFHAFDNQMLKTVINCYSHCGGPEIEEAQMFWSNEIFADRLKYHSLVITALVDCYSRKGYINEAHQIIEKYHKYHKCNNSEWKWNNNTDKAMWLSVLSACKTFPNHNQIAQNAYNQLQKMR